MTRSARLLLRVTLALVGLTIGASPVLAYLSPEDVFGSASSSSSSLQTSTAASSSVSSDTTNNAGYSIPHGAAGPDTSNSYVISSVANVTPRNAADIVAQQQASAASARAYFYSQQFTDPNYQPPVIAASASSASLTSSRVSIYDDNYAYQKRMDQLKNSPSVIIINGNTVTDAQGRVLHSGAPNIAASGPADILFVIVLLVAASLTFYSVWREQKKVRRTSR